MISKDLKENLPALLKEVENYINGTYGEHYAGEIQQIDVWQAQGTLTTTALNTSDKYTGRYGKKNGNNKKDLLKAIHYILMVMQENHGSQASEKPQEPLAAVDVVPYKE